MAEFEPRPRGARFFTITGDDWKRNLKMARARRAEMVTRLGEKLTLLRPEILGPYHRVLDWLVRMGIARSKAIEELSPLARAIASLPTPEEVRDSIGALDECLTALERIKTDHPHLIGKLDLAKYRLITAKLKFNDPDSGNHPDQSGEVQNSSGDSGPDLPGLHDGPESPR